MVIPFIIAAAVGYLLGSIPFALIIGKVFFKTDIRNHGSGNLGGGNAGRVLGKGAGLSVMTLDILKFTLAIFIASLLHDSQEIMILAGLFAAVGHCFPVFARFKGGKAVATMYGFLFGMTVVAHRSPLLFLLPLAVFLIIILITRIIAISSIGSALAVTVYAAFFENSPALFVSLCIFSVLIIVRHRANIIRMIRGEENKVSWIKRK